MIRLVSVLFLTSFISSFAQDFKKYYAIVVDVNKPFSNKEFVDQVSTRGARFIYREMIRNKFTIGADLGFSTYSDRLPPQVYSSGNSSTFAELFTYVYNYTLTLSGEYYFMEGKSIKPFAGFGVGAAYNNYTAYYNVYGDEDKTWGVLLRPNGGVLMRFGIKSRWAGRVSLHFDYSTTKSTDWDYKNFTALGVDAGLAFVFR